MRQPFREQCRWPLAAALLLLAAAVLPSCMKDAPDRLPGSFEWNPGLAFPVGEKSLGLDAESGFDTLLLAPDTLTGLPGWVDEASLLLRGTIDFDLSAIDDNLDHMNWMLIRISIENGFPDQLLTQAYFMDAAGNPVDSLFSDGPMTVSPGTVQGDGETVVPASARRDALFERDRAEALQEAAEIMLRARIMNPDPDPALIPHYPLYHFTVRLGAMIDVTIQF